MKAFLIKDWKLLKNQKQFFGVILPIYLIYMFVMQDVSFAAGFVTIMFTMFTISTISYDEYENGLAYLFTLPVTRRAYVAGKYVYGMLVSGTAAAASFVVSVVISNIMGYSSGAEETGAAVTVDLLIAGLFLSAAIPAQLKFGAEKGRIALMAVTAALVAGIFGGAKLMSMCGVDPDRFFVWADRMSLGELAAACLGIDAVLLIVSAVISMRIMKRREF